MYYAYHFGRLHEFDDYTSKDGHYINYIADGCRHGNYLTLVGNTPEEAFEKTNIYLDRQIEQAREAVKHAQKCVVTWVTNKQRHQNIKRLSS